MTKWEVHIFILREIGQCRLKRHYSTTEKTTRRWFWYFLVARGGIEPPTQGFSTLLLDSTSLFSQKVHPTRV